MPQISPNQHGNSNRIDYITVIADGDGEVLNKENENTCIYKAVIARRVPAKFDESGINVYTEYELVHILLFLYEEWCWLVFCMENQKQKEKDGTIE